MWELLRLAAGAVVGALVAYNLGWYQGESYGYDRRIAEVAVADGKAEVERRGDDARIQGMDDYDLCVLGLRSNGMPVDACEQLRRVGEE
jgi:hypothetical protein